MAVDSSAMRKTANLIIRMTPEMKRALLIAYPGRAASSRVRKLIERDLARLARKTVAS